MNDQLFVPAPFWRRLIARLIDLTVCAGLTFVAIIPVLVIVIPASLIFDDEAVINVGALLCFVIAYVLIEYFLLRRRGGQTLGKGLLGLRVIEATDKSASRSVGARAATLRMAVLIGPFIAWCAAYYATYREGDLNAQNGNAASDAFAYLWFAVFALSALTALLDRSGRRGLADFVAGTRVIRAQKRGIHVGEDLRMLVPGKVDMTKHQAPAPAVTLTKPQHQPVPLSKS